MKIIQRLEEIRYTRNEADIEISAKTLKIGALQTASFHDDHNDGDDNGDAHNEVDIDVSEHTDD